MTSEQMINTLALLGWQCMRDPRYFGNREDVYAGMDYDIVNPALDLIMIGSCSGFLAADQLSKQMHAERLQHAGWEALDLQRVYQAYKIATSL